MEIKNFNRIFNYNITLILSLFLPLLLFPQSSKFISVRGTNFYLNENPFFFSGTNAYYSMSVVANKDTNSLIEVFTKAKALGMSVIRIWGFYDKDDNADQAIIQYSPGKYNEHALQSLDYVLKKAADLNLKIIITLVNNWEDYGGMNQYIEWLIKTLPATEKNILSLNKTKIIFRPGPQNEKLVFYRYNISPYFTHDDFYSNPTIKGWYKNYIRMLINRFNVYKKIEYKNDTTIFAWELANEAESTDKTGLLIYNWINEMAGFIKTIDVNHLVGTGESGFDINENFYSSVKTQYNAQKWMFNADKGISYSMNTRNSNIDFGSCHLYKEDWELTTESGKIWIQDHKNIATGQNKPFLLGEYGSRQDKEKTYTAWLNTINLTNSSGCLLWQLVYNSKPYNDGYFVYYPSDNTICNLISDFFSNLQNKKLITNAADHFIISNYPNPCTNSTVLEINVPEKTKISTIVFNSLGQQVIILPVQVIEKGVYFQIINISKLPSGVYFINLHENDLPYLKKFIVIK